jgi:PAS domain S-box-containing protein
MNTTEHKQGKERLRESEKKYRQIVEILQEGVWVKDKDEYTPFINPSMIEILGYTVKEKKDKHLFSFMDKHGVNPAKQKLELCKQCIKDQYTFEFIKKEGEESKFFYPA